MLRMGFHSCVGRHVECGLNLITVVALETVPPESRIGGLVTKRDHMTQNIRPKVIDRDSKVLATDKIRLSYYLKRHT